MKTSILLFYAPILLFLLSPCFSKAAFALALFPHSNNCMRKISLYLNWNAKNKHFVAKIR